MGGDRFESLSAGSHPAGFIHPLAIEALSRLNIPLTNQTSKSWSEFADTRLDVVVTLCDAAAAETCPVWSGSPMTAHWSLPDPVYYPGTDDERLEFALMIAERLRTKIAALVGLDWSSDRVELKQRLGFLGEI